MMKKSHKWDTMEVLQVKCPYCRQELEYQGCGYSEGDKIRCWSCGKKLELGRQR